MREVRLFTVSPDNEALWVRLYVQPYADQWAAMLVGDEAPPPREPATVTGLTLLGENSKNAWQSAKAAVRLAGVLNRTLGQH
jgi:hypothetical protein